jgi:hypothetical protein
MYVPTPLVLAFRYASFRTLSSDDFPCSATSEGRTAVPLE